MFFSFVFLVFGGLRRPIVQAARYQVVANMPVSVVIIQSVMGSHRYWLRGLRCAARPCQRHKASLQ